MTDSKPNFLRPTNTSSITSKAFWEGLRRRRFLAQKCQGCDTVFFPPRPVCPECLASDPRWTEVSGRPQLHSWTEVHIASPEFDTPFFLGLVDLPGGIGRVTAKITGAQADQLRIGMPVEIAYVDVEDDFTLYCLVVEPSQDSVRESSGT